ncbi:HNH endonuclease [Sorangium sp. So ce118]
MSELTRRRPARSPHRLAFGRLPSGQPSRWTSQDSEGYTWHHHQDGTAMQLVPSGNAGRVSLSH